MKNSDCEECAVKAAWIGLIVSMSLAAMKYYIGWVGGSAGVVAIAIHSTVCMFSSASILFTHSFAKRGPDERFHYGYGKIEFVVSALVNTAILVVMGMFFISNIRAILDDVHHVPHVTSAIIAAISIMANETVFRYYRCVAAETNSPSVTSAAWAIRSDALTSLVVLLGIIGTSLGVKHLDPVIAVCITLILLKIIGEHLITSIRGLMDYSVDEKILARIKNLIKNVSEVKSILHLRARSMGQLFKIDLELGVSPELTVEQTAKLEDLICELIHDDEQKIGDITIGFSVV
ncbi:cation diffusion facilitator family transporter [Bdellovibrionota bacterium FG-1]